MIAILVPILHLYFSLRCLIETYCIINGVPRDLSKNAAALAQQLVVVCAVLQSLFQLLAY